MAAAPSVQAATALALAGLLAVLVPGCTASAPGPASEPSASPSRSLSLAEFGLPADHGACVAAGGAVENASRGGRCYVIYPKSRDAAAYAHCRQAGGAPRAAGPRASRDGAGDSHVCTLSFAPPATEPF